MRVALYVRRSTDEHQAASLGVQEDEARRFCTARAWDVAEVFVDDAVSRSEFKHRPGLIRLLAAATSKAHPFGAVVIRDETRLGGDLYRTGMVLQDLHDAGVRVLYYATGEEVSFDNPTAKFMAAARLFASELEREKIASRVREHLQSKARRGLNVGGVVFGYDNLRVHGEGGQAHTEFRINDAQAATVREIFERRARGEGYRLIVRELNALGILPPRAGRRGTGSWSPSVIFAIIHNERYIGQLVWGRMGSAYRGGTRVAIERGGADQIRTERPELRIISPELWAAVRARDTEARTYKSHGIIRYLLSGLARCGLCGGPMQSGRKRQGDHDIHAYQCAWARDRGDTVCRNHLRRPLEELDGAVVGWIRDHVLNRDVISETLALVREQLAARAGKPDDARERLSEELRRIKAESDRIAEAIAHADEPPEVLLRKLSERERRAGEIKARLATLGAEPPSVREWPEVEAKVRARVAALGAMLSRSTAEARTALKALIRPGTLRCQPVDHNGRPRYLLTAQVVLPFTSVSLAAGGAAARAPHSGEGVTFASPEGPERYPLQDPAAESHPEPGTLWMRTVAA